LELEQEVKLKERMRKTTSRKVYKKILIGQELKLE